MTLMGGQMGTARTIALNDTFTMPIDAVTQTFAIVGKRGRGKSSTAKVLVEEMVGAGQQVIVLDTVGAWWGLRSSLDGGSPGLPVVVFGGRHGDVPLEDTAGAVIARTLMKHRVPAVIDLSEFRKAGQRRFATAFIEELYHSNRDPLHVVFDEADEFAPQTPLPDSRALLGAMEDFVRRGRLRGLGATLVSQRPAVIHKDVLSQAEVLITMGLTSPRDVSAINEWIKLHADDEEAKEVRRSLASLPVGTAWVWSPEWLETLQKVAIRRIRTFDSSATPKVGADVVTPTARAEIDLGALGEEIAATIQRKADDDPKALRTRIATLEKQLSESAKASPAEPKARIVEVPARMSEQDRDDLATRLTELEGVVQTIQSISEGMFRTLESVRAAATTAGATSAPSVRAKIAPAPRTTEGARRAHTPGRGTASAAPAAPGPQRERPASRSQASDSLTLSKAQRAIASALATHGTLSQRQLGLHTGYAHKSGSFSNALSGLRTRGLIEGSGAAITLTPVGFDALDAAGGYEPLPTGPALVEWWLSRLPKAQAAMLSALLDAYPDPLSVEQLGAATGYAAGSGSFSNARSKLNVAELIHGSRDALYAADELGQAVLS